MEQFLPSFHNKSSVTIAGVFSWEFHHSGMVQHPSPGAPACSTEPVWGAVHPGAEQTANHHCDPTAGTRHHQTPVSNSNPFWATQLKHQVSNIYPWHGIYLKNLLLGPVILCLPDFPKIKRNQHLSNLSQAAAITGPKRFQTCCIFSLITTISLKTLFFSFFSGTFCW